MGVTINLNNIKMSGNSQLMNNAKIHGTSDCSVSADNLELSDSAKTLNDLEINSIMDRIELEVSRMDPSSEEFSSLKNIVNAKSVGKKKVISEIARHLGRFTEGVLQNIISDIITGR